jgi:hypothetical protein
MPNPYEVKKYAGIKDKAKAIKYEIINLLFSICAFSF